MWIFPRPSYCNFLCPTKYFPYLATSFVNIVSRYASIYLYWLLLDRLQSRSLQWQEWQECNGRSGNNERWKRNVCSLMRGTYYYAALFVTLMVLCSQVYLSLYLQLFARWAKCMFCRYEFQMQYGSIGWSGFLDLPTFISSSNLGSQNN